MLAIAILVIVSVTVYQFTDVTIRATDASLKAGEEDMQRGGFRRLIATQLASLPAGQSGSLIGMNIKNKGAARRDAMQLVCPAGNAVLTPDAKGYYQITLDLRETPRGSGHFAMGLERQPWTDDDDDDDDDDASTIAKNKVTDVKPAHSQLPSDWVMLMDNVKSLEIAYFDARLNGWVDKWVDQAALPNLVRLRVTTPGEVEPYEFVERVPGGGLTKVAPPTVQQALGQQQLINQGNVNPGSVIQPNLNRQ